MDVLHEGDIVLSLMGHDKGKLFYVLSVINDDFVFIADGKNRKVDAPKQKRQKHLRFIGKSSIDYAALTDKKIRTELNKTCVSR